MAQSRLIAGAMSGTSADGVDVALVRIDGSGGDFTVHLLHHHYLPYEKSLRQRIFAVRNVGTIALGELASLGRDISLAYSRAVNEALLGAGLSAADLAAVAAHGQTLYHAPPDTIQWLDPALIAAEVGAAVVSDFRRADCAAGGQGAPLVPYADYLLFRSPQKHRLLLNLGGIANITWLAANAPIESLVAFDTGPGNCVSDWLMREMHPTGPGMDLSGALAARGTPDESLVLKVLSQPFFKQPPPRSTDGPAMIDLFFQAAGDLGSQGHLPAMLATACLLSAAAIARAVREFLPAYPDELIVSGGGEKNRVLMDYLRRQLEGVSILRSNDLGIPGDAKEAVAFALLAAATLEGRPANVLSATGARRAVILGSITPKP